MGTVHLNLTGLKLNFIDVEKTSRVIPAGKDFKKSSVEAGIYAYRFGPIIQKLIGELAALFGYAYKTESGDKTFYLNKNSLVKWLGENGAPLEKSDINDPAKVYACFQQVIQKEIETPKDEQISQTGNNQTTVIEQNAQTEVENQNETKESIEQKKEAEANKKPQDETQTSLNTDEKITLEQKGPDLNEQVIEEKPSTSADETLVPKSEKEIENVKTEETQKTTPSENKQSLGENIKSVFSGTAYEYAKLPKLTMEKIGGFKSLYTTMQFPVMKGRTSDGKHDFIAIKVQGKNAETPTKGKPSKTAILLVNDLENMTWSIHSKGGFNPEFLPSLDKEDPQATIQDDLVEFTNLIQTGEGKDAKGNSWKIVTTAQTPVKTTPKKSPKKK